MRRHTQISAITIASPALPFPQFLKDLAAWLAALFGFDVGSLVPAACIFGSNADPGKNDLDDVDPDADPDFDAWKASILQLWVGWILAMIIFTVIGQLADTVKDTKPVRLMASVLDTLKTVVKSCADKMPGREKEVDIDLPCMRVSGSQTALGLVSPRGLIMQLIEQDVGPECEKWRVFRHTSELDACQGSVQGFEEEA
eukprot:SAG11_NODE_6526_length_1294_cov_3.996411_2_plen_199_part_00